MRAHPKRTMILVVVAWLIVQLCVDSAFAHVDPGATESFTTRSASEAYDKHVYVEDFEDGWADNWGFGETDVAVKRGATNSVLSVGPSSTASYLFGLAWSDYVLRTRVKLLGGDIQIGFRQRLGDPNGDGGYFLGFFEQGLRVIRARSGSYQQLAEKQASHRLRKWYSLKISVTGNVIKVFVDGVRRIRVLDDQPVPFGSISLSAPSPLSKGKFDDVAVTAKMPFAHTWTLTNGPEGLGTVTSIVSDPTDGDLVYAGTYHSGMQRSADGGETWTSVLDRDGLQQTKVRDIGVAPSRPTTIYVTHQDRRGGSISRDGGIHWTPMGLIGDWFEVSAVAVDPSDADHLYVGARTAPFGSSAPADGVYESTDGGETWASLQTGIGIHDLVIAPSAPDVMYAGTVTGVLKSTDGGVEWAAADGGLVTAGSQPWAITQMVVDPRDEDVVYARAFDQGPMFKTTDGGVSWERIRNDVSAIALAPSQPDLVYSAEHNTLWRSENGGESWTQRGAAPVVGRWITAIDVDPGDPQRLHLGGFERIAVSDDGGATSRAPHGSFKGAWSSAIATSPNDPEVVYVGHGDGRLSKTTDGGDTWLLQATLGSGTETSTISDIATSPLDPNLVFVSNLEGIFRSTDAGQNFSRVTAGLNDPRIISLAVDPSDDSRIFAGTGSHRPYLVYEGTGMYRSSDGGDSWTKVPGLPDAPVPAIVVHPADHNIVWASFFGYGIYRSTDGGDTWAKADGGFVVPYGYSMAVDPTDPDVAYATTIAYYGDPNYLEYQGQNVSGVYRTENGGATWELILLHDMMENVVVSPTDPSQIFATSHTEQVWHSSDGGKTWTFANDDLARYGAHLYFFDLAITADGSSLYLANCGRGVYRNVLNGPEA